LAAVGGAAALLGLGFLTTADLIAVGRETGGILLFLLGMTIVSTTPELAGVLVPLIVGPDLFHPALGGQVRLSRRTRIKPGTRRSWTGLFWRSDSGAHKAADYDNAVHETPLTSSRICVAVYSKAVGILYREAM
jgi:hypothetical protein